MQNEVEIKNAGSKNSVYSSSIHNCTENYSVFSIFLQIQIDLKI